jgi:hypothetical protein
MGPNGSIYYEVSFSYPNNADTKTLSGTFGGSSILTATPSTTVCDVIKKYLRNRGVTNSQVTDNAIANVGSGTAAAAPAFLSIDTTSAQNVIFGGTLAVATDYIVIQSWAINVVFGA